VRRKSEGQRHLHRAAELIEAIRINLQRSHPELDLIVPAGEFRRGCELVSDISVVARTARLNGGPADLRLSENISLHITDTRRFGITLILTTSADAHLDGLRGQAQRNGAGYRATPRPSRRSGGLRTAVRVLRGLLWCTPGASEMKDRSVVKKDTMTIVAQQMGWENADGDGSATEAAQSELSTVRGGRKPNSAFRSREYLTEAEIEALRKGCSGDPQPGPG
jgi:hypothetical protein